ncbi:MAG TPA: hypothetical protein VF221_16870 [Chloroflexota bacterium]
MRFRVSFMLIGALLSLLAILPLGQSASRAFADSTVALTTQSTPVGTVLFTADGKALYMLSFDTVGTASPAVRSCTGRCEGAWPPLLAPTATGPFDVSGGVQQAGLGTIGTTTAAGSAVFQVTYFGHPLYMFINDKAPGQANGENVTAFNGVWDLVTPAGLPAVGVASVNLESTPQGSVLSASTAGNTFRSLYLLTGDPPNGTTCVGTCTRFWPPLLTSGTPTAGTGVNVAGLGTTKRPDGTLQATYFGVPLYMFALDLGPGAQSGLTNGLDVAAFGGMWYLMSAAGVAVPGKAIVTSTTSSLGTLLAYDPTGDPKGAAYPLYAFTADTGTASACMGMCARYWTPLITTGAPQVLTGSAAQAGSLGTMLRADGTTQVTYNGRPLYLFAPDFSTSGQNLTAFGGTFQLMQGSGTTTALQPAPRPVTVVPQLVASSGGISASFIVAFTSKDPGASMVLFGPGPGCSGLVETATRDAGAGTTSHSVTVAGNDLGGSVGDNGIQPGATYWFEVVTVGASGPSTDDNGGKCYSVTVPTS